LHVDKEAGNRAALTRDANRMFRMGYANQADEATLRIIWKLSESEMLRRIFSSVRPTGLSERANSDRNNDGFSLSRRLEKFAPSMGSNQDLHQAMRDEFVEGEHFFSCLKDLVRVRRTTRSCAGF